MFRGPAVVSGRGPANVLQDASSGYQRRKGTALSATLPLIVAHPLCH